MKTDLVLLKETEFTMKNTDPTLFMDEAIRLATENVSLRNGGPFGAVVVKNGKIVGRGYN